MISGVSGGNNSISSGNQSIQSNDAPSSLGQESTITSRMRYINNPPEDRGSLSSNYSPIITRQPLSFNNTLSSNEITIKVESSEKNNESKRPVFFSIFPGIQKAILKYLNDNISHQLDSILESGLQSRIATDVKEKMNGIQDKIKEAKANNDHHQLNKQLKEASNILNDQAVGLGSKQKQIILLTLQGVKVRQPLVMPQLYFTTPAFFSAGSAKIGIHINIVSPSITFLDKCMSAEANNEIHLQVFMHNEAGAAVSLGDFGKNFSASLYGAVISHDGVDLTLRKEGKWTLSNPKIIVERVVRGEGNIAWNKDGANVQWTLGGDYVSQRFFSWDKVGLAKAATHIAPKWIAGGAACGVAASQLGFLEPTTIGVAAGCFHLTDQVTKAISERVNPDLMQPEKELKLVELATLSAPVDGGYTDNSGFGGRLMFRMNAGAGIATNNTRPVVTDDIAMKELGDPDPTKETSLRHRKDVTPPAGHQSPPATPDVVIWPNNR